MHVSAEYTSVRVDMDAYHALERRKRPEESFSDVIERLARERPITDLAGILSESAVASIREARTAAYEEYAADRVPDDSTGRDET